MAIPVKTFRGPIGDNGRRGEIRDAAPGQVAARVGAAALVAAAGAPAHAQAARPRTIPALREWTPAAGVFAVNGDSRILVRSAALLTDAEVFAEDLRTLLGHPVPVVSDAVGRRGRRRLPLALGETDPRVGREGYRLRIGSAVEITATSSAGAFYGTRTMLQLLHQRRRFRAARRSTGRAIPSAGS